MKARMFDLSIKEDIENQVKEIELLKKECILAGSSSGSLIAAAIRYCKEQQSTKNVVTLVCDTGNKYLKIFDNNWLLSKGFVS